ncbi:unnamed protein product [Clonostachys chloroleuca]|uniref:Microbial-type PARG catalytic domain-containing protein n=1 Tax=Clonostachys chloroleuca TaxID=1926264 RepID=A0AA35PXG7_9HYPO|nr:unnamed protein product [Clonostachys chloroleuca]
MSSKESGDKVQRTLDSWFSKSGASGSSNKTTTTSAPASTSQPKPDKKTKSTAPTGGFRENARRRTDLAAIAKETRTLLPDILPEIPNVQASKSEALYLSTLPALKAADCPKRKPAGSTAIRIVNEDTFNAAIELATHCPDGGRVAVLNMASHSSPGGGWLKGALAQEEALCYRSSLALSLHRRYYPWKQRMGLYSPDVVVIRSDMPSGHNLLVPDVSPADLPIVSVLSIAAPRCPDVARASEQTPTGGFVARTVYAQSEVRELMKDKMRLCLRMAAQRDHGLLVLGALGCGAFRNPPREVAHCWLEVLKEAEFEGGWWEEVWFAVYDRRNEGNFEVFEEILGGVEI